MKSKQNLSPGHHTKITINPEQVISLTYCKEILIHHDRKTICLKSTIRSQKQNLTNSPLKTIQIGTHQNLIHRQCPQEQ